MKSSKLEKYIKMAQFGAETFSTCGKRQYYAIILDVDGTVVGTGYNGSPPGATHCVDGGCPRLLEGSSPGSNYDNCVSNHAEVNAIMRSDWHSRRGGTIVVNGTPCYGCAKAIAGSGLKTLAYIHDDSYEMAPKIVADLTLWGVECCAF